MPAFREMDREARATMPLTKGTLGEPRDFATGAPLNPYVCLDTPDRLSERECFIELRRRLLLQVSRDVTVRVGRDRDCRVP